MNPMRSFMSVTLPIAACAAGSLPNAAHAAHWGIEPRREETPMADDVLLMSLDELSGQYQKGTLSPQGNRVNVSAEFA